MSWLELFKFQIVGNKYRITYLGHEPLEVYMSLKIVGVNSILKTIRFKFNDKGHWIIPSFDYRGCSLISFRNLKTGEYMFDKLIDKSLSQSAKGQNVICIGLNKTGTTSFTKAMQDLGYVNFPENELFQFVQSDLYYDDYGKLFSVLNNPQFNLFNDKPFAFPNVYKKIYEERPNDIFLLTLRKDVDRCVKTCLRFWECLKSSDFRMDKSFIHTYFADGSQRYLVNYLTPMFEFWGLESLDNLEEKLTKIYEDHRTDCLNFFKGKSNFYVVNIEKEGEFKKFTNWLGIENSIEDFPWENKNHYGLHS